MSKAEFSINNYVEFKLTQEGVAAMYTADEPYKHNSWFVPKKYYVGQTVKMPAWEMINKFGHCTGLGRKTFCEASTISLVLNRE